MTRMIDITDASLSDIFATDPLTVEDVVEALADAGIDAEIEWADKGWDSGDKGAVMAGPVLVGVGRGRWFITRQVRDSFLPFGVRGGCKGEAPVVQAVIDALQYLTD